MKEAFRHLYPIQTQHESTFPGNCDGWHESAFVSICKKISIFVKNIQEYGFLPELMISIKNIYCRLEGTAFHNLANAEVLK